MTTRGVLTAARAVVALLLAAGLGGCAMNGQPYGEFEDYYPGIGYTGQGGPLAASSVGSRQQHNTELRSHDVHYHGGS